MSLQVLIVDDDPDSAQTLGKLVAIHGYDCRTCTHGADCLATVEELRPEVILLDLSMPQMSGFDIAEELREHEDLRPKMLVAVTGYGDDEHRQRTAAMGFDHHLTKPVNWDELAALLKSCFAAST
jgi:CheY-like chemotaxis protein